MNTLKCTLCNRLVIKNQIIPLELDTDGYSTKIRMTLSYYEKVKICEVCASKLGIPPQEDFIQACK